MASHLMNLLVLTVCLYLVYELFIPIKLRIISVWRGVSA